MLAGRKGEGLGSGFIEPVSMFTGSPVMVGVGCRVYGVRFRVQEFKGLRVLGVGCRVPGEGMLGIKPGL